MIVRQCAITASCLLLVAALTPAGSKAAERHPNIVVIYADDLGYGDVSCYNPQRGKISTPNIDRLAAEGMRFTDGHSSSGVCSPSRYTLLTGRYHWRTRLQQGIVSPWERPLIDEDRLTVAELLKEHGYRTACIGKWHLGWDWPISEAQRPHFDAPRVRKDIDDQATDSQREAWRAVFSQPIAGGPITRGFDSYFGTDVPNWPPYCFIDNDRTVGIPTEYLPARLFQNRLASRQGPALEDWQLEPILPTLGEQASALIAGAAKQTEPFFIYMPLTAPHTPLAVTDEWKGRSGLGVYADFVMETDAVVGQVLEAVEASGAADNTLVLFTSDNGCSPIAGVADLERQGHFPSGPLRGYKSDVWEGGHRVPFIVRWPGVVRPGSTCDQLVHQADLIATCAAIVGSKLPETAGEDSVSLLPLLKGSDQPTRETAINQSSHGLLAFRDGPWKLIVGPGSGGWSKETEDQPGQLYNLDEDLGETTNLYNEKPEMAAALMEQLEAQIQQGRSTPGAAQENDVTVKWKRFMR